jgi:dTDP-4-dehydrorhamnose reductase
MESGAEHLIFRTSWVYSVFGKNFPATMLKLSSKMDKLTINTDQIGAPTSAELLASVTARALERHLSGEGLESGIYNLTAGGHTNWMDYAKKLFVFAIRYGWRFKSEPLTIMPSQGDDPLRPAKRPKNSRLSTEKIQKALSITLPPWEYHLERYVQDLCRLSIFKPSKPFRNYLEKN